MKNDEDLNNRIDRAMRKLDFVNKYDFYEFLRKYSLLQDLEYENEVMKILKNVSNVQVLKRLKMFIRAREKYLKNRDDNNIL